MDQNIIQEKSIALDRKFQSLSAKEFEIVKAINCQDLVSLVDLGLFESTCHINLNFTINSDGLTPLMLACSKQNPRLVQLVVNTVNLNHNATDNNGYSALHIACQYQSLEIVKLLQANYVGFSRAKNGSTPLHIAVKANNLEIVKFLVEVMKADVDQAKDQSTGKITPISIALSKGYHDMVEYLASKGARVDANAFYQACKYPNIEFTNSVIQRYSLIKGYDNQKIMNEVINKKYEKTESTPLIRACNFGNIPQIKFLIEKMGADPSMQNRNDENCLHAAVRQRHLDVVSYLCNNVVRPKSTLDVDYECSRNGLTAFARAALQNDFEIADLILKQGKAFKNYVNKKEGLSILQIAQKFKNQQAVNYLQSASSSNNNEASSKFQEQGQAMQEKGLPPRQLQAKQEKPVQKQEEVQQKVSNKPAPKLAQLKLELVAKHENANEENSNDHPEETKKSGSSNASNDIQPQNTVISPLQIAIDPPFSLESSAQTSMNVTPKGTLRIADTPTHYRGLSELNKIPNNKVLSVPQSPMQGSARPISSEKKKESSQANMKETIEKLNNLKNEYRQKYSYKNFAGGEAAVKRVQQIQGKI